jgi:hypothetical protein
MFSVRFDMVVPKEKLILGLCAVCIGLIGFWIFSADENDSGLEKSVSSGERTREATYGIYEDGRRLSGLSRGTGVGRRKMDRNEILEVGKRLRWELNPLRRRAALGQLLEGMNQENVMLVREQIVHFSEESPEFQDFHFAWGAMSGLDAVNKGADTEEKDMAATMTGWASVDPVAALSWYDALDEERRKCRDVTFGILKGLASSDLDFATDFVIEKLEAGNEYSGEMMDLLKDKMLEVEPLPIAAEWAAGLPEGKVRNDVLIGVTEEFVKKDAQEASTWAATLAGPEGKQIQLLVAGTWAKEDPVASLTWARNLPDDIGKKASVGAVVSEWTRQDVDAVYEFLNDMPRTNDRDAAIEAFSARIAREDPYSAIAWADEIQDSDARRNAIIHAGRALMKQNPDEAHEWLRESGLSNDIRNEISN